MRVLRVSTIVALLLFISTSLLSAESATAPGSMMIGGGLSFTSTDIDNYDENVNILTLAPSMMLFVVEGLSLGMEFTFMHVSVGQSEEAEHRYMAKALFMVPTGRTIRPYLQGGGGFIQVSDTYGGDDQSNNGWTITLGVGVYAFLNEHYAIRTGFDYTHDEFLSSESHYPAVEGDIPSQNTFAFSLGFAGFVF
jgi:opacity protein-like surface antigen